MEARLTTNFEKHPQLRLPYPTPRISLVLALLPILVLLLLPGSLATAQVGSASLGGIVQDPSGAAVADASVTLENVLRGSTRVVKSNAAGVFSFAAMPSGDYDLKVEKAGFSNYVQKSIHLDPGDSLTLTDVRLAITRVQVNRLLNII